MGLSLLAGAPCLLYTASPLHSRSFLERLRGSIAAMSGGAGLREAGVATSPEEAARRLQGCPSAAIVVSTGGTEHIVLAALEALGGSALLIAHPYANSLPALMEVYPLARRMGASAVFLPSLDPDDRHARRKLEQGLAGLRAATRLRGSRLGLIGRPSPWLIYSRVEPARLREKLGVELVEVPLEELYSAYERAEADPGLLEEVLRGASRVEVQRAEVSRALRLYAALRTLVERHRLDAFTIECFSIIGRLQVTACLALSLFNDSGLVAGCEGDVPATVAMMLASWVSGRPSFMANPSIIDGDRVMIAHCTAARGLGTGYRLRTHFESGMSVGLAVTIPKGQAVTLVRLDPGLTRLRVARGAVEEGEPRSELHCRTQVWIRLEGGDAEKLLRGSMGNHYILVPGDWLDALTAAAEILGLSVDRV